MAKTARLTPIIALALLAACNEPQNGNANKNPTDSNATAGTAQTPTTDNGTPLTLPVLDALFFEEGFEADLKNRLALTDGQVSRLKTTARNATEELTEDGAVGEGEGSYAGSAREATRLSEEQLRSILGEEKARQLSSLIAQRYASGDVGPMVSTEPNAVPKDTRIVVNAPAYRMDVFQDGKLTKTYKVGIGYPEFPLPTGMRRAETIIFNPTWTPPDEPWVKGKFAPGKTVEAGSKDNPLGYIKIPIGLPSLIHGGKQAAKLGTFASHGCVGLTNEQVQEFAGVLANLGGSPISADSVAGFSERRGKTNNYKLAKPVPVELRYETIVAENGGLRIFRDVYERGTNTVETARRVLEAAGTSYDKLTPQEQQALTTALDEMNRDARGDVIASDTATASGTGDRAKQGKKTTTIAGRKEVAVPIAALSGKGYPAPVALNTGGAPAAVPTR